MCVCVHVHVLQTEGLCLSALEHARLQTAGDGKEAGAVEFAAALIRTCEFHRTPSVVFAAQNWVS